MIKVEHISRTFGSGDLAVHALSDISFEIHKGEFVSIVGKSGAGKSTLIHQLSLLDSPTEGKVFFQGKNTTELTPREKTQIRLRQFGYIFQDYALLPELVAEDNVMLPLMMQGHSAVEARGKAAEILAELGLGERLKNLPSQLSGGEQQRVSIARAIAHHPAVLFADEPTANLDSDMGQRIIDVLKRLNTEEEQTIIMVTHEDEYSSQTSRIITLSDGRLVADSHKKEESEM